MDVKDFIRDMNSCVPVERRTLAEHIDTGDRTYKTKDGSVCSMDEGEIDLLSRTCTEQEKVALRLPIFISTDTSADAGAWKVDGAAESAVVARMLGKVRFREDTVRLHNPDMRDLRKLLPNATFVIFMP